MSSAPPLLPGTRPPTFDRLALVELLGGFVLMTAVFGILTARVIDIPSGHGHTTHGLAVGFAVGAGSWGGCPARRLVSATDEADEETRDGGYLCPSRHC